ncbi:MAG: ThuA domain-containing protein, partial [Candidatus Hydrogenedentes bacterium]|nr:ThuA domain-containing protein [Candidatus Hydrogenedentota bacterium]
MAGKFGTLLALAAVLGMPLAQAQDKVLVLFLSKSAGFEHSCIKQENGLPSHVDKVLKQIGEKMGAEFTSTKDAGQVNAENLKRFNVVIFFTTGVLTEVGADKNPPMAATGVEELLTWIRNGGGFIGYHCASDSFHRDDAHPESPYLDMVGGEFLTHGAQFEGKVDVVDPGHPAMANFPNPWLILDEWYAFKNMMKDKIHVLA